MATAMQTTKEEEVRNEELSAVAEQEKPPTERELRIAAFLARDEEQEAERAREHRLTLLTKIRGRLEPELHKAAAAVEKERLRLQDQKLKPWNDVNSLLLKKQSCVSGGVSVAVRATKPTHTNQRGLLRAQLRSRTIQTGTRWLAKELGYKDETHYLHNLKVNEITRKEASLKQLQMEREREIHFSPPSSPSPLDSAVSSDSSYSSPISPHSPLSPCDGSSVARSCLSDHLDDVGVTDALKPNPAIDVEAPAHVMRQEDLTITDLEGNVTEPDDDSDAEDDESSVAKNIITYGRKSLLPSQADTEIDTLTQSQDTDVDPASRGDDELLPVLSNGQNSTSQVPLAAQSTEVDDSTQEVKLEEVEQEEAEEGAEEEDNGKAKETPPKDRAAEYRRMLELDYQSAKRSKSGVPTAMLEDEAEEEDEEILKGLGDFGFGVPKASDGADDDEAGLTRVTEDDLQNIVDDVSDGEGDDEQAEEFRRAAVESEEREALKRVVERVREGYDKDRTVRGAVRGKFGLNELTAAGNKAEARRLNLLTADELNSDQEDDDNEKDRAGAGDDEEDLEEALTKALVDRHMRRTEQDVFESDSEDESDAQDPPAGVEETEEEKAAREEEQRQKLREKLFKLRARMRRVLRKQKSASTTIGFSTEQTQLSMSVMDEGSQSVMFAEESRTIMNLVDLTNRGTTRKSNNMYQGVLDQEQLDAGYGMGMAVSKKHKTHNSAEATSSSSSSNQTGGLFANVTSSAGDQALKRRFTGELPVLQRQASFATVAKRQCLNRSKTTHSFGGTSRNAIAQQFVFMSENSTPGLGDSNTNDASRDASIARSASMHQRHAKPVTTIGFGQPITTIGFDLPSQSQSLLSIALAGKTKTLKRSNTALKPKN